MGEVHWWWMPVDFRPRTCNMEWSSTAKSRARCC